MPMFRPLLLVAALAASGLAWGEDLEPLDRIARLSYVEGEFKFQSAQESSFANLPDRPLRPGDGLITANDGRAEFALGTATLRAGERSALSLSRLDASSIRFSLTAGSATLHLHELLENETFEIATPNTTIAFQTPGEYRVDVPAEGATELTVRTGTAEATTSEGPVRVGDGQRVRLEGRDARASLAAPKPADAFDEWVLEREVKLANAEPPTIRAPEEYQDEALGRYGEWQDDARYGRVWMPSYAYGGGDPFGYGYWQRSGFGYSWYDPMPWSANTFYYGRWAYLRDRDRWCWVPTRRHRQRDHDDPGPISTPRRIEGDVGTVFRRTAEAFKRESQGSAPVASSNPEPGSAPHSAPARERNTSASSSGTTTMRPARPAQQRSDARESRPAPAPKGSPSARPLP